MFRFSLFLALLVITPSCGPRPVTYAGTATTSEVVYARYRPDSVRRPADYRFTNKRKNPAAHYYPDTGNLALLPMRTVRVNVHLLNTADTLFKYHGRVGADYARQVVGACNELLRETPELWLQPAGMDVPALPRRLRVTLARDPLTGEDAIYDHFDDGNGYLHKGRGVNRGDRGIIKKYAVRDSEEINLFIMGPPRDSFLAKSFKPPGSNGVFVGNAIKIAGWMEEDRPYWEHRFVVTHEILHALGLGHAWLRNDGCDDTKVHGNDCWARSSSARCDTMTSNNIMDYSNRQQALTPCQIGRVHARISEIGTRQRAWTVRDWCAYRPDEPIEITAATDLDGDRDYRGDINVRRGATLRVNGRLHLPTGAGIFVDPGGSLELGPEAIIHNDCGGSWRGIFVGRRSDNGTTADTGSVKTAPSATLLDVAP